MTTVEAPTASLNIRRRKTSRLVADETEQPGTSALNLTQRDFEVRRLPNAPFNTPIADREFLSDDQKYIMYDPIVHGVDLSGRHAMSLSPFRMLLAQASEHLHFDPKQTTVGVVTCGGLCPGLNDVVRGITYMCRRSYDVKRVVGFRYGYWGLSAAGRDTAIDLDTNRVHTIHRRGGTFLGSSRGPQDPKEMVDTLQQLGVNILFTIGGDGTQRGASKIVEEVTKRKLNIAVVGIPKTIDNDLSFSHRTFGYITAVEHATLAIRAAYAEAGSHPFGVGIVKVMGRHSGFIAAEAAIASQLANICLIPENVVTKETFFNLLECRFRTNDCVVICVAEGFGQDWMDTKDCGTDASGNKKLGDIGTYMRDLVTSWMKKHPTANIGTVKLIDPSYMIRAVPANTSDASFCVHLATLAVHEAFRGTTDAIIVNWYRNFTVIPIKLATSLRKVVDLHGDLWRQVREVTVHLVPDNGNEGRKEKLRRRIIQLENDLQRSKTLLGKL
jgi:6-phosphofructokinase 1